MSAQPWMPEAIAATPLLNPGTSTALRSLPQHLRPPVPIKAQLTVIAVAAPARPETSTGVGASPVDPPQHLTPPSVVSAQLWNPPAAMALTPLRPTTSTTRLGRLLLVPSPSAPLIFAPQHLTPPAPVSAQVCRTPAAIAVTPLRPETSTGVARLPVVWLPSWSWPLSPQHLTRPARVNAQL